jgi:exonuclease III
VFCIQEIRCSEKTRPEGLKTVPGYPFCYWLHSEGTGGHHGVATFCKTEPISVEYGLPIKEEDNEKEKKLKRMFNGEGRLIATEFEKFFLLNTCKS